MIQAVGVNIGVNGSQWVLMRVNTRFIGVLLWLCGRYMRLMVVNGGLVNINGLVIVIK